MTLRIFYTAEGWKNQFPSALAALGHEIVEFQYEWGNIYTLDPGSPDNQGIVTESRRNVSAELIRQIKKAHAEKPIDLLFRLLLRRDRPAGSH